jgi:hypothetical protein
MQDARYTMQDGKGRSQKTGDTRQKSEDTTQDTGWRLIRANISHMTPLSRD